MSQIRHSRRSGSLGILVRTDGTFRLKGLALSRLNVRRIAKSVKSPSGRRHEASLGGEWEVTHSSTRNALRTAGWSSERGSNSVRFGFPLRHAADAFLSLVGVPPIAMLRSGPDRCWIATPSCGQCDQEALAMSKELHFVNNSTVGERVEEEGQNRF